MTDYTKLVEALRICSGFVENSSCSECDYFLSVKCRRDMMHDAAAAIKELLSFAHYVADKVTRSDEDWEDYHEAFTEVACRKLVKLGIVSVEDDKYVYSVEVQE